MKRPFIVALDLDKKARKTLLSQFSGHSLYVKVGMELFYREGIAVIDELKEAGHAIFLDLKLHDIPNTVARTMQVLAEFEVDMINVHAAGGAKMIAAARDGLERGTPPGRKRPILLAVTQLTSTDQRTMETELLIERPLEEVVRNYSALAKDNGADGVVCSAKEVPLIHETCGPSFYTVCPGIRRKGDDVGDQKRVVTPEEARKLGCWAIVVGRSITQASDPYEVYTEMKREWEGNGREKNHR